jgi:decaprenylphospho-beta-D-erythro-pentofuranosid-2-ulose 2-reductase
MPTALILGGGSDIGTAISRRFAEEGFDIQLTARKADLIVSSISDIVLRYNVHCEAYSFDAEDFDNHVQFFENLSPKPDVVIYVIGFMGSGEDILKSGKESRSIIDSNYTGAVSILNIVASHFARAGKGSIIGISSVAGERGRQSNLVYGSAKAAFTAYLSGLRNYLTKFHVNVLTVKPGFVNTKMTSHLELPALLTASGELVARKVFRAYKSRKNTIYVKGIWRWIMMVIRNIPEPIFKKLNL